MATGSIPSGFPISLRSWPAAEKDFNQGLPTLIVRINAERGGFRDLTEEGLQQEIAEAEAAGQDGPSDNEEDEENPDLLKEAQMARDTMLQQLEQAHGSATIALDFVSLLLSKEQPGIDTLTPFLKERFPGTFGMSRMAERKVPDEQKQDSKAIATGWKMQNLNKSVDSILASATRLEKEIEIETKYWEQVLAISEQGWSVCKLPNDKHTLGVRYGFAESAPAFKNRSLAALLRDDEGNITLTQGMMAAAPQVLRARIRSNGEITGSSAIPAALPDDASVEAHILQSRNTIFSEEIWQEVNREARSLASLGVRSKEGTIVCPLSASKSLVLDIVTLSDTFTPPPQPDDRTAEGLTLALQLLLCFQHRKIYRTRTDPSMKAAATKHSPEPFTLLRPIITRLGLEVMVATVHDFFTPLCKVLNSAGLSSSFTSTTTPITPNAMMSPTESIISSLIEKQETTTTFQITPKVTIIILSKTFMTPVPGAIHHVTLSPEDCPLWQTCKPPSREEFFKIGQRPLDSWKALEDYVLYATSCAVLSSFVVSPHDEPSDANVLEDAAGWQSTVQPYILRQRFSKLGRNKQLTFMIQKAESKGKQDGLLRATIKWEWLGEGPKPKGEGMYHWIAKRGRGAEGDGGDEGVWEEGEGEAIRTLEDVVEAAGKE